MKSNRLILGGATALTGLPVLVNVLAGNAATPFRYFAADAFYYFTIARNFAVQGKFSFDQITSTNGFHPLWQIFTGYLYWLFLEMAVPETGYLTTVLLISAALVTAGVALSGSAFIAQRGRLPLSFLLVPVGFYALLLLPVWAFAIDMRGLSNLLEGPIPLYGTLWSYMNGMESGLTLFFFGLLLWVSVRFWQQQQMPPMLAAVLGLIAAAMTLARLDHAIIAASIGLMFLADARPRGRVIVNLAAYYGLLLLVIATYLLWNYLTVGVAMPISAANKTTFPAVNVENFYYFVWVLSRPFSHAGWLDQFYRLAQIFLPALVALLFGYSYVRATRRPAISLSPDTVDRFLLATGVGVLGLAAYNFLFVQFYGMGHWYFPVSVLYSTLVVVNGFDRFRPVPWLPGWRWLVYSGIAVGVFVLFHLRPGYHDAFVRFYFSEASQVKAHYGANPPKLIEYDDGIIAFSTGFPTMSGLGYALDAQAAAVESHAAFVELAYARGFDHVTSLVYKNFGRLVPDDPELKWYVPSDEFTVTLDYQASDGSFGIIKLSKPEP